MELLVGRFGCRGKIGYSVCLWQIFNLIFADKARCDNEIDSHSSMKVQCLVSSVYGEHLATIVIGNSKQ